MVVSSGAIALGMKKLGYKTRPKEMARLQAAAAAGQSLLMRAYEEAFGARGLAVAQVLLTHADLADRSRANNARAALGALLEAGAVPILNENDSVAVDEIRFGDNDQLAAMVAPLVDAELVVLLSDVEGLLDGAGRRVPVVTDVAREAIPHVRKAGDAVGTGGMASKVEAARRATLAGANVVVADARSPDALDAVLRGDDAGTLFVAARRAAERQEVLDRVHAAAARRGGARPRRGGGRPREGQERAFGGCAGRARRLRAGRRRARSSTPRARRSRAASRAARRRRRPPSPGARGRTCRMRLADLAVVIHADELVVGMNT